MLWKFRRHTRPLLRPILALAALLWLAVILAPCLQSAPRCDSLEAAMPCSHAGTTNAGTTNDCDIACLQSDFRNVVAAIASFPAVTPLLLAMVVLMIRPLVIIRPIIVTPRRAPDTPLHLQFARLLI